MSGPCVPEVIAHETLDPLTWLGARISQQVGRSLLHLMTQGVLIPSGIQVQRRTHSQKEILGLIDACRIGRSPAQEQHGSVSIAIVRAAVRSRSAPGASFTSGSS